MYLLFAKPDNATSRDTQVFFPSQDLYSKGKGRYWKLTAILVHIYRGFFSAVLVDMYDPNSGNKEKCSPKCSVRVRVPTICEH